MFALEKSTFNMGSVLERLEYFLQVKVLMAALGVRLCVVWEGGGVMG